MPQLTHPLLKPRQIEILLLLYRFRFLTRPQIQTLLHHKNHRLILTWLNHLTEQNYITQYYTKTIPASPAIYSLAKTGRMYLRNNTDSNTKHLSRLRRESVYTSKFRGHCILVADIYLSLLAIAEQTETTLHFSTKAEIYGMQGLIKPEPDAYIAIEEGAGETKRYFLDVLDTMPPRAMRKRVKQYFDYYESDEWQSSTDKPFPEILLVCPHEQVRRRLTYAIQQRLYEEPLLNFYVTIYDKTKSQLAGEDSGVGEGVLTGAGPVPR